MYYPQWFRTYRDATATQQGIETSSIEWNDFMKFFASFPARLEAATHMADLAVKKALVEGQKKQYNEALHEEYYRLWCALRFHWTYWQTDDSLRALLSSADLGNQCDYDAPCFTRFASFTSDTAVRKRAAKRKQYSID